MNWENRFLELSKFISSFSKDPSTKVGCVIFDDDHRVISVGFNGFPKKIKDTEERLNNRDIKILMTLHAELNAILFSKESLEGKSLSVYPFQPCASCASAIIQKGIKCVIAPKMPEDIKTRWYESCKIAEEMFLEAGVILKLK